MKLNDVAQTLLDAGFEFDRVSSVNSGEGAPIIVYLPDVHADENVDVQRERIQLIDSLLDLDAILLEGIAHHPNNLPKNKIPVREKKRHRKMLKDLTYFRETVSSSFDNLQERKITTKDSVATKMILTGFKYAAMKTVFDVLMLRVDTDTAWKYNASGVQYLANAYNNLMGTYYSALFDLDIPFECPGSYFIDLKTRSKKRGLEKKEEQTKATAILSGIRANIHLESYNAYRRGLLKSKKDLDVAHRLGQTPLTMQDEMNKYNQMHIDFMTYLDQFRTDLIAKTAEIISLAQLDSDIVNRLNTGSLCRDLWTRDIVNSRSETWLLHSVDYPLSLLVGGIGHTESLSRSAYDNDSSLIVLDVDFPHTRSNQ